MAFTGSQNDNINLFVDKFVIMLIIYNKKLDSDIFLYGLVCPFPVIYIKYYVVGKRRFDFKDICNFVSFFC